MIVSTGFYSEILTFYTASEYKYPSDINNTSLNQRPDVKSRFRQSVKPYKVEDDIVMHIKDKVLTKRNLHGVLKACHDNPVFDGHFGRDKTYKKISQRYYWKGMLTFSVVLISMLLIIGWCGPIQESSQGNKYIVAITDHFSKWNEAAALPQKTVDRVADFLYMTVCRLGCMDTLSSDQGWEFVNSVMDHLLERMSTEHRISLDYHPQTNGQQERDNRTLKEALAKLVNDECNNWDTLIPGVLLAYHSSEHVSTKILPFEVMYWRNANLPIDLNVE